MWKYTLQCSVVLDLKKKTCNSCVLVISATSPTAILQTLWENLLYVQCADLTR